MWQIHGDKLNLLLNTHCLKRKQMKLGHVEYEDWQKVFSIIVVITCVCLITVPVSAKVKALAIQKEIKPLELTAQELSQEDLQNLIPRTEGENTLDSEDKKVSSIEELVKENKKSTDAALELLRRPETRAAVEWFYILVANDREVALAILDEADRCSIPPALAFALAYTESRYKPNAKHVNTNGTIDRGLFQLNSSSFPKLTEEEFYDPKISAHYGMAHLRYCMDTAGNEIAAMAMYNAGTNKVHSDRTPKHTLDYIAHINDYRIALEERFAADVLVFYQNSGSSPLLAKK